MDFYLYLWSAIVIIVFLSITSGLLSQWIRVRYKARNNEFEARLSSLEEQTNIAQLNERIRVLESIVTDHQSNLRKKIDAL